MFYKKILAVLAGVFLLSASIVWADPPAPVPKTGQTTCYDSDGNPISCSGTGQDGDYQKGIAWPVPRFTDHGNGTVTDNLTGLMWAKNANLTGGRSWQDAMSYCHQNVSIADRMGWRLPTIEELSSLLDTTQEDPALPSGHPFVNVQSSGSYWSSTTFESGTGDAWVVPMSDGVAYTVTKSESKYLWPVRGGQ